ncbi:hypothetical protein K458DRAFT_396958 [Lentithecium fluviatile CBS 122367]|uniref:Uncharacterized protein n=1 Tax=Lentithecium fluviatile CBS 122367 TaxID=1168545 RepID=A0A6G1IEI5_9PLEO|nr:hypothetical protein K458DRAFT_396958 [Lentithecium fluviatile CBS 122367]
MASAIWSRGDVVKERTTRDHVPARRYAASGSKRVHRSILHPPPSRSPSSTLVSYDAYPDGLGKTLLKLLPLNDPETYRQWLEEARAIFSDIEASLERHVWSTCVGDTLAGKLVPSLSRSGSQTLHHVYVVDLDREQFVVGGCCYFRLDKITPDWDKLLPQAKNVLDHDPSDKYGRLSPRVVEPKRASNLNRKPHFALCKKLFGVLVEKHDDPLTLTGDTAMDESEFLFQEMVFSMLCLASCSTELVRLASSTELTRRPKWPYAAVWTGNGNQGEFLASIFQGFHLPGVRPGSAPKAPGNG